MKSYACSNFRKLSQREKNEVYELAANNVGRSIIAAILYSRHLKGWRKGRIRALFDDLTAIFDIPAVLGGKNITDDDVCKLLTDKYGIDFDKIHIRVDMEGK